MKTLYLDFDHTIFDLDGWQVVFYDWLAAQAGVSYRTIERTADATRDNGWYCFGRHLDALSLEHETYRANLNQFAADTAPAYLMSHTENLLTTARSHGWQPFLITAGDEIVQRAKVGATKPNVDAIHYTDRTPKAHYLLAQGIPSDADFIFIDDAEEWRALMQQTFPNSHCYPSVPEALSVNAFQI